MQIKITMRHSTPVRMAIIKKTTTDTDEGAEKGEHQYTAVGM